MMKKLLLSLTLGFVSVSSIAAANLPDFTQLVEKEGRAVVNISTTSTIKEQPQQFGDEDGMDIFRRFGFPVPRMLPRNGQQQQPRERQAQSLGSGFIMAADGYILTNAHVIAQADEITVKLTDKRTFKAKVIGADARTDVALLKIDATGLPKVTLGDANKLKVGEWVVAIGSPFGFENTVTAGIVSAKGRSLPDETFVPFIQTDVAINPGNSGGPLFNMAGEVVGINSQIYSRSGGFMGLSFSIPVDVVMKVADELKATGKVTRGRIGVAIQELNDDLAKSFGLGKVNGTLLASVEKDGPADKAGLKPGDVILKFNGQAIATASDLPKYVAAVRPGTKVPVQIWRDKALRDVSVTIGVLEQSDRTTAEREYRGNQNDEGGRFGLSLQSVDPAQLKGMGLKFAVLVQAARGPAAKAGLQGGDLIVGVANQELTSLAQLKQILTALKPNEATALRVIRGDASMFLTLRAPAK
ncbi:DegQ family serine endoprotease [Iodobacter sp. LRB]|uniref:DegQ family serine endoprotease n=1 Tax=unclassified Iodobacter TaxID=235634 RepID=UPI000C0D12B5|nr:DegQ family serine endoprotease [Iodobacter sp. BJB302]PHV00392.1 protease Do [Iodobacter sp. BJB302]